MVYFEKKGGIKLARSLASIDIGTNTFRLLISELNDDGQLRQRVIKREITRLGGGFSHWRTDRDSMVRGIATSAFSELLRENKVDEVRPLPPAWSEAPNGREFVEGVRRLALMWRSQRDEESLLPQRSPVLYNGKDHDAFVFDIGGGHRIYTANLGNPVYSKALLGLSSS